MILEIKGNSNLKFVFLNSQKNYYVHCPNLMDLEIFFLRKSSKYCVYEHTMTQSLNFKKYLQIKQKCVIMIKC